jgi:hypothetical protein
MVHHWYFVLSDLYDFFGSENRCFWDTVFLGKLTKGLFWTQFESSLDVKTHFDLGCFLSATDLVPCYFLYNFYTYGLLGKGDFGHYWQILLTNLS